MIVNTSRKRIWRGGASCCAMALIGSVEGSIGDPAHAQCGTWLPLGDGLANSSSDLQVYAFAVYNSELIAGGHFISAGGQTANNIARWNGSRWQTLATGMNSSVEALTVYNNELIAGGSFTLAGGQPANLIACWNGST